MTSKAEKNTRLLFWVFSAAGLLTAAAAAYFDWGRPVLGFLWSRSFLVFLKLLLGLAFGLLILKWITRKFLPQSWLKWIYGMLFLPALLLPIFRCYFKVPYVFCRACPHKCPWGILRSVAFPAFLLLNLSNRFWCTALCPLGTFQECQARVSPKRLKLPLWGELFAYVILLLVTGMYLLTLFGSPWEEFFEMERYAWVEVSVLVAAVILIVAFFIPKFFCRYFCPVGTMHGVITGSNPFSKEAV